MKITKVRPLVPVLVEFADENAVAASMLTYVDYGRNKVYNMHGEELPEDFFSLGVLGKLDTPIPETVVPKAVLEEIAKKNRGEYKSNQVGNN